MKAAKHPLKKHIIWFLFLFFIVWNYIVVLWTIKPGLCRLSRGGTLRCICPGYNNLLRFILIYLEPPEYDSEKHHSSLKYLGHGVEETGKENQIKSVHTSSRVSLFKIEFSLRQRWEISPLETRWSCHDPLIINKCSITDMLSIFVQCNMPRLQQARNVESGPLAALSLKHQRAWKCGKSSKLSENTRGNCRVQS